MAGTISRTRAEIVGVLLLAAGFVLGFLVGSRGGGGSAGEGGGGAHERPGVPDTDRTVGPEARDGQFGPGNGTLSGPVEVGREDVAPGSGSPGATGSEAALAGPGAGPDDDAAAGGTPGRSRTDRAGPPSAGGTPDPARTEGPSYTLPEKISGTLVDARTGKPIPGATVSLLWCTSDGTQSSGLDVPLREDGTFELAPEEAMRAAAEEMFKGEFQRGKFASADEAFRDLEYRLRVSAKGYVTREKGDPGARHEVALEPELRNRLHGSLRVEALWPDDSRFAGRLLVNARADDRDSWSQWALPETDGTYLLVGIPAGRWAFTVAGKNDSGTLVDVQEGVESRVKLPVPRKGVEEWPVKLVGEPREVEVATGNLAVGPGACVRAEPSAGCFFRVDVLSGRANFPALPAGKWTFVLQVPESPEVRFEADVPAGAGRLALKFP